MGAVQKRMLCKTCGDYRLATKAGTSHVFHLIVSVLTLGLWIPFWFLACVSNALTPFRCTVCGKGKF